ncbi:MAG: GAF domain-containing protein, partial [Chloroflexi bacterium]
MPYANNIARIVVETKLNAKFKFMIVVAKGKTVQETNFHRTKVAWTPNQLYRKGPDSANGISSTNSQHHPDSSYITTEEIPASYRKEVFDAIVYGHLPLFTLGVGLLHTLLSVGVLILFSSPLNWILGLSAGGVTVGALTIWLALRWQVVSQRWSHPLLTLETLLTLVFALVFFRLFDDMRLTMFFFFIMVGSAQIFLSSRWFYFVMAMIITSWTGVALQITRSPFFFGSLIIMGAVVSIILHLVRQRSIVRHEFLRLQDRESKKILQYRARQLETSLTVGQHIAAILELDVLLHQVASLIKTEYAYDYVSIYLLDEDTNSLRIQAGTGDAGRVLCLDEASLPVDEKSLIGWVGVNGRSLRIADVTQDSRYVKLQSDFLVRSELDLPLLMGNRLLGVLNIQSRMIDAFSVNDLNFLQLLATQVANAIYNASLYEREKSARYLAETLQDTGRALTSTLEWDVVIDSILEGLEKIVTYDRASVLVRRDNDLEIMASRGFPDEFNPIHFRISLDNELIYREIKESKRPLSIPDAHQRSDWRSSDSFDPPRSWLGVPLIRQNIVTGMLSLARETVQPYTDEEIELATAFAAQAVIALENARLYEQTSRFNRQLEYEVRHRTEAIQTAYEKLEHLNRSKSDFISIISHELRTPVTILSGYSQMLVKDQMVVENEMLSHLAVGMKTGASRLQEIINSMLDVAKIDNQELNIYPTPISVAAIARIVTVDFSESLQARNLTLDFAEMVTLPIIYADSEALQKVFFHLITNAIKYTPDGGKITISGGVVNGDVIDRPGHEAIEMIVSDSGIGIDREMHELVFDKFYQTGEVSLHSSSRTMFKGG